VSRTDEANGRTAVVSQRAATAQESDYAEPAAELESSAPTSSRRLRGADGGHDVDGAGADERARLITDIGRLIREPEVPEATRLAGLTLIGWLARRRPDEPAHAVGVEEARKCERRWQAARAKAR